MAKWFGWKFKIKKNKLIKFAKIIIIRKKGIFWKKKLNIINKR